MLDNDNSFIFTEENLLLCLTDNVLSTYNINGVNFPLVKTFEQTKGASLFALDNTVSVILCCRLGYWGSSSVFSQ